MTRKVENAKGAIRGRKSKVKITKGQTMIYKTQHRKLKTEQLLQSGTKNKTPNETQTVTSVRWDIKNHSNGTSNTIPNKTPQPLLT